MFATRSILGAPLKLVAVEGARGLGLERCTMLLLLGESMRWGLARG
jgi:hypothetical protein